MTRWRFRAPLVVLLSFLACWSRAYAGETGNATYERLRAIALANGYVDVIVGLKPLTPFLPEASLPPAGRAAQRAAIRALQDQFLHAFEQHRAAKAHRTRTVPSVALAVTAIELDVLRRHPLVASVEEDFQLQPSLNYSGPWIGANTDFSFLGTPAGGAFLDGYTGFRKIIAVLDTGVQLDHPFFKDRVFSEACYSSTRRRDLTDPNSPLRTVSVCPGGADESTAPGSATNCLSDVAGCYHGTFVAGIALGRPFPNAPTPNAAGIATGAMLLPIQIYSGSYCSPPTPYCYPMILYKHDINRGLDHVLSLAGNVPDIAAVNISANYYGEISNVACDSLTTPPGGDPYDYENAYTAALVSQLSSEPPAGYRIPVVVSSGNAGATNGVAYPACVTGVIAVGASSKGILNLLPGDTQPGDQVWQFTNVGVPLTLFAPGDGFTANAYHPASPGIYSSTLGSLFGTQVGTSMAAPHVSAALAVLREALPTDSVASLTSKLQAVGPVLQRGGYSRHRLALRDTLQAEGLPTRPPSFAATGPSARGGGVSLSWGASTPGSYPIDHYEVDRLSDVRGAFQFVLSTTSLSAMDNAVTTGQSYLYRVRAVDTQGRYSPAARDIATVIVFGDNPLVVGSTNVRVTHVAQLRTAVSAARLLAGLPALSWTDPTLTGVVIRAVHIAELRDGLREVRSLLTLPTAAWTDDPLVASGPGSGRTKVRAIHVTELRNAVR